MNSFWGNIFASKERTEGLRDLLRQIPLFTSLSDRDLAAVEHILHERQYQPHEEIFRQGEPGVAMYIIHSGSVIIRLDQTGQILAELNSGEFFGELALLDDSPRSATAVAKTTATIFAFSQPDLFVIIERNPRLGVKITTTLAKIIGERLKHTNAQLQSKSHVPERKG